MPLRFFATAIKNGAVIKTYTEVLTIRKVARCAAPARDHTSGKEYEIGADIVINAAGPGVRIADMVGVEVPIRPRPVMLPCAGDSVTWSLTA